MVVSTSQNSLSYSIWIRTNFAPSKPRFDTLLPGHLGRLCFSTNHLQNVEPYDPLSGIGVISLSLYPVAKLTSGYCVSEIADRLFVSLQIHLKLRSCVEQGSIVSPTLIFFGFACTHQG